MATYNQASTVYSLKHVSQENNEGIHFYVLFQHCTEAAVRISIVLGRNVTNLLFVPPAEIIDVNPGIFSYTAAIDIKFGAFAVDKKSTVQLLLILTSILWSL